jgi:hypothetical protein
MIAPMAFLPFGVPIVPLRLTLAGTPPEERPEVWAKLLEDYAPSRQFFSNIPTREAGLVARYHKHQWQMLDLAARFGLCALELMASSAALAFCIGSWGSFASKHMQKDSETPSRLLRMRRKAICGCLGFPATEAMVRILSKVPPEDCRLESLLVLRERVRVRWIHKALSHLPVINKAVLAVLRSKAWRSVTPAFLAECATHPANTLEGSLPGTLLDEAASLYQQWKKRRLRKHLFKSVSQLERFIRKSEACYNDEKLLKEASIQFPPPPLPGTETIQPISTPHLLHEEARQQHNCVRQQLNDIVGGMLYLYRMIAPERATIGIYPAEEGWKLGEILGAGNKPVSEETERVAKAWVTCASSK